MSLNAIRHNEKLEMVNTGGLLEVMLGWEGVGLPAESRHSNENIIGTSEQEQYFL